MTQTDFFQGKGVFVTGGGSGIGRATALAFAERGARVAVADLSAQAGEETVALIKAMDGYAMFLPLDVADAAAVDAAVEETASRFGAIACACNCAGVPEGGGSILDSSAENWTRMMEINLRGTFHALQAELRAMRGGSGGSIVNVASRAGLAGAARSAAYSASKHGVVGLTRSAAIEFAAVGIRVNAVAPGLVETPFTRGRYGAKLNDLARTMNPMGRMAQPSEIAAAIVWLSSPAASFVAGVCLPVDGGALA